jgi:hypothetical protein
MQISKSVYTTIYSSCLGINCSTVKATDFLFCSDFESLGGRRMGVDSRQNYKTQ